MTYQRWFSFIFISLFTALATSVHAAAPVTVAQAAPTCIASAFSQSGGSGWYTMSLKITNNCSTAIDFQNSTITFQNTKNLSTSLWGDFGSLSYPDNTLQISSQPITTGGYLATLTLHFPTASWAKSKLPAGQSFTLHYGAPTADYLSNTVQIYTGTPVQTGEIDLTSNTAQPSGVTATTATIDILSNGQIISKVQLPWKGQQQVINLAAGNYSVQPESVTDTQGNVYQGSAIPSAIVLTANQKVSSTVTYQSVATLGSINVKTLTVPAEISGYSTNPSVTFTRADTSSSFVKSIPWNATTNVTQLPNQITYKFSTPVISYKGYNCSPTFTPTTLASSASAPQTTQLSYACVPMAQDKITINVSGLPSTLSSTTVIFTPNDTSNPITQTVNLTNGSGSATLLLNDGVIYKISSDSISGYSATFNPQPLTATPNGTENITWQKQTGGRIISYMTGWKTPPAATDVAAAGYTNIIVAFGVFSTSQPGQIVSAFDTITKSYIDSLHALGIKVSLSLGGASSGIANTTVDFHQALSKASSSTAFAQAFVKSVESFVTQYGFDGIDIDIESGLNAAGTFTNPTGDIAVLANIINQLHANNPALLISLVPQTANVAATSGFSATWGNYASLIMQTASSLSWVGIQLYNTGCMMGIDGICYDPNKTSSTDFSVAMATDLLANWPAKTTSGAYTGFQPYIAYLNPSQVVVGYPVVNSSGVADASPVTPVTTIKYAIQCLRTAKIGTGSCSNYVPPKAYPGIGGVFNWEISYDQSNAYQFAKGLKACVLQGNCS
ncbi:MAG: glycosyl hydrolase family 18 protein [Gammaproteobacteria bacterium]|nr:glycosyl hydrolase family 18 protein [Gammaproteobacteria bacterium]